MLFHDLVSPIIEPSVWMLKVVFGSPPLWSLSSQETEMESRNAWIICMALLWASPFSAGILSWKNLDVTSLFHMLRMVLRTMSGSLEQRLDMANINEGHFMGGVVMRKVMLCDAQTICWRRIWQCMLLSL